MFDKVIEISLLYDFYGQLLTNKQNEVMHLYYEDDLSLGEIAEILHISRQAVYDTIKKSEKLLKEYETKLKLVEKFKQTQHEYKKAIKLLEELMDEHGDDKKLIFKLEKITEVIREQSE